MNLREAKELLSRWNAKHKVAPVVFSPAFGECTLDWANTVTKKVMVTLISIPENKALAKEYLSQIVPSELNEDTAKTICKRVIGDRIDELRYIDDSTIAWNEIAEFLVYPVDHFHNQRLETIGD